MRRALIPTLSVSGVGALCAVLLAQVAPALAQDASAPSLVAALHAAFGEHHARAVHAKGVILEGSFEPTSQAAQLCSAAVFAAGPIPVTVRFSDFTGLPAISDSAEAASPRGMAIKLRPARGDGVDVVAHSFNGFPVATAAEFGILMRAIGASGPGVSKPTPLDNFLASHPVAQTFLTTQKPPPASYATAAYFGVNAVRLTGVGAGTTLVRFRFVPLAGEHELDRATLQSKGANYLTEEIAARVAEAPVRFDWLAQVAGPGDVSDDPSAAWPETRTLVKLGTVTIDRMTADQVQADKHLLFLPANLPSGIQGADPMLAIRSAAYPISFAGRQ